jgi:hypothetical protein
VAAVTVCVPAYVVGCHIEEALTSLREQTFGDFIAEIGLEPPSEGILAAVRPFLADSRFRVVENPERLGWDGNIRALLTRVATPHFVILPHDDRLDPDFIGMLLGVIKGRPDASIAYSDTQRFGSDTRLVVMDLPAKGPLDERLLAFFLGGAEGTPWRGVARSSMIARTGGFPNDGHSGFAVECEWVLKLLLAGPAVRVNRPLFLKRGHPADVLSVSRARLRDRSDEQLVAAMDGHRARMLGMIASISSDSLAGRLLPLAARAAMIRRHVLQLRKLNEERLLEAESLSREVDALADFDPRVETIRKMIARTLHLHARGSANEKRAKATP